MNPRIALYWLLYSLEALLTESSFKARGQNKAAIHPYLSLTLGLKSCHQRCVDDQNCNSYSVDTSDDGCFLSTCNMVLDVQCSSCYAASRRNPTASLHCPMDTSGSSTTPETPLETTRSSEDKSPLPYENETESACPCMCKNEIITIVELIEKRRQELRVDKSKLSATVRKRICAFDSRVSSTAIGLFSVIIMIVFGSMLICSDINYVLQLSCRKCKKSM